MTAAQDVDDGRSGIGNLHHGLLFGGFTGTAAGAGGALERMVQLPGLIAERWAGALLGRGGGSRRLRSSGGRGAVCSCRCGGRGRRCTGEGRGDDGGQLGGSGRATRTRAGGGIGALPLVGRRRGGDGRCLGGDGRHRRRRSGRRGLVVRAVIYHDDSGRHRGGKIRTKMKNESDVFEFGRQPGLQFFSH